MHLEKLVEFGHFHARPFGDALFAAGLKNLRIGAFFLGHRLDQRDLAFQDTVVETGFFDLFGHLVHAGHHAHHALHAAHLLHLLKLHAQVIHGEVTLHHAFDHFLGLLDLERFLRLLDQRHDVAHAENTTGDALGLEGLKRVHFLAQTHEFDRLARNGAHRKCRTAASVTVHPGQHHACYPDAFIEVLGRMHSVLTGQAIDHQKRLARVGDIPNRFDLRHQFFVD